MRTNWERRQIRHLLLVFVSLAATASAVAGQPFEFRAGMHRVDSGNYYVAGSFGHGVGTEFLVDTGSGYVALSPATFARVKALPGVVFLREITGSMADGRVRRVPVYQVATLQLGDACHLHDIEVAVIPGSHRDILGLSALAKVEPFAMQLSPPVLMVSNCEAAPQ